MLEVINLECTRGDRALISGMSFSLAEGELLHVIGSNGSGKTTLLRTLCGLSRPSAGEIRWGGTDIRALGDEYRSCLSYVGHNDGIQGELTPAENLQAAARLGTDTDAAVIERALEQVGLTRFAHLPTKVLSQGQKRRLALARLLVLTKALWILDEPVSGLDARSIEVIERLLAKHLARGGLLVVTSHQGLAWSAKTVHRIGLDS